MDYIRAIGAVERTFETAMTILFSSIVNCLSRQD